MEYNQREQKIRGALLEVILTVRGEELGEINDDDKLRDQLEMDSMDFLDIVMEFRKRYKVEIPKENYPRLATIRSSVEYLNTLLPPDF